MKHIVPVVLLGAATMLAASALTLPAGAQTTTKPPAKPAPAAKPAAATTTVRPPVVTRASPAIVPRPVFVPPAAVLELDEIAVVPDLPTVLDADSRERYRRIFQAQAAGQYAQADSEIAGLKNKVLMGYVGAQRLLGTGYAATYDQLAAWLQDYNDHPDAPAIYKLALARRGGGSADLTPSSFVSQAQPSPSFAAARTVTGSDAGRAADLRGRLQHMVDHGGFVAGFALLDQKSTAEVLGPQEVELWRGRLRTRALEADPQAGRNREECQRDAPGLEDTGDRRGEPLRVRGLQADLQVAGLRAGKRPRPDRLELLGVAVGRSVHRPVLEGRVEVDRPEQ